MGKEKKVNNVITIKERSEAYAKSIGNYPEEIINMVKKAYVQGAKDQRKLDIDEGCEWILNNFVCDGYQFPLYYRGVLYQPKYIASDFREDMEKNQIKRVYQKVQ